jgi:hypothetical protein
MYLSQLSPLLRHRARFKRKLAMRRSLDSLKSETDLRIPVANLMHGRVLALALGLCASIAAHATSSMCDSSASVAAVVIAHARPASLRRSVLSLRAALAPVSHDGTGIALYVSIGSNRQASRYASLRLSPLHN